MAVGTFDVLVDRFIMCFKDGARISAPSIGNVAETLSGPVALCTDSAFNCFFTQWFQTK